MILSEAHKISERLAAIRKSCEAISHNYHCPNTEECKIISCGKISKIRQHHRSCQRILCGICKQYNALINYHAKICKDRNCLVEGCAEKKQLRLERRYANQFHHRESSKY